MVAQLLIFQLTLFPSNDIQVIILIKIYFNLSSIISFIPLIIPILQSFAINKVFRNYFPTFIKTGILPKPELFNTMSDAR